MLLKHIIEADDELETEFKFIGEPSEVSDVIAEKASALEKNPQDENIA